MSRIFIFFLVCLLSSKVKEVVVLPDAVAWIIIVACLLGSFFFSCCETSLACCNRFKMQAEADEGKKTSKLVVRLINKFDRSLTTVLIGNNIVAVAISAIATTVFYGYLKDKVPLEWISLISSIIMAFVVYVLGDTLPKTIAKVIPDTMSKIFAYPLYILCILLFPISIIFELLAKLVEVIFKVKEDKSFTSEDFENIVEHIDDEDIDEENLEIIQSAIDFADAKVKDVLTPKRKMFALDINDLNKEKLLDVIKNSTYSRIPIYKNDFNNVIGVIYVKTYVNEYLKDHNFPIRKVINKPYFITPDVKLIDLLEGFKKHHTHIAIVRNEKNLVLGMITMEDLLAELVSDIDEPNKVERSKQ